MKTKTFVMACLVALMAMASNYALAGSVDVGGAKPATTKAFYSAGTAAKTATAAGTGPFFSICGSATKMVRVERITISGTVATAAVYGDVIIDRTSAATSACTATALTALPRDSTSATATATLVNYYTVLATAGATAGVVRSITTVFPITATVAAQNGAVDVAEFDFQDAAPVLRGIAQCVQAFFGTTTTNAPTLSVSVLWTED